LTQDPQRIRELYTQPRLDSRLSRPKSRSWPQFRRSSKQGNESISILNPGLIIKGFNLSLS